MTPVAIALPRPLQPWQQWLGWFDAELALQVGELVRRLAELVGNAPDSGRGGQPEPDGLGDLRSRGPYEHLLASEWLLAEELPDEFLRRAVSSEHLFLAPRLRAARVERSVIVVFDCGPRALGAARLAHIAAWILLARRAGEQGGTLRWGVLQAPGALHPGDTPAQLGAFMRSRRADAATAAHLAQWRASVDPLAGHEEREVWWIGASGPGLPEPGARNDRVLTLNVPFEGDTLDARLAVAGSQRRTSLPLPPTSAATALLRGDFKTAVTARRLPASRTPRSGRLSLTQGLLMSVPPGHVGVPELGHPTMLVFGVPRSGQDPLASPRRQAWSSARPPLAAGLSRSVAQAVCATEDRLHFWQMPGFDEQARPPREDFEASNSTGRWLALVKLADPRHQLACVIDSAAHLVTWRAPRLHDPGAPQFLAGATVVDRQVRVMAALGLDRLAYAMVWGDGIWLRELTAAGTSSTMQRRLCPAPSQVLDMVLTVVGFGTPAAQVGSLAFAHRLQGALVWQVLTIQQLGRPLDAVDGAESQELRIAQGERGVGLVNQRGTRAPALVVLSADKRRLRLATHRSQTTLYESAAPIERCAVCPISDHVAVLTRDRQLVVLDPVDLEPLLVVSDVGASASHEAPEGDPDDA